jgi:hypothetical protein
MSFSDASGVAVDSAGGVYVVGVASPAFPVTAGAYQTTFNGFGSGWNSFVAKLNSSGNALVYSSFLGFTDVGRNTAAYGVAVDASGDAYVTGSTPGPQSGFSFPTTAGALQTAYGGGNTDAFVTEFNSTGTGVVYSSYLGGGGDDSGAGIAVGSDGRAFVTGSTTSSTLGGATTTLLGPGGGQDAFVAALAAGGATLSFADDLGGTGTDAGNALALDGHGDVFVTGSTASSNFPTTAGAYQTASGGGNDAFVTELDPYGVGQIYSTFLGGSGDDFGNGIAVGPGGRVTVTGQTASTNFATTLAAVQGAYAGGSDAFVSQLNAAGSGLTFSTFLGGLSADAGNGVGVDSAGNLYVAGVPSSGSFPTANAFQSANGGQSDAFAAKLTGIANQPPVVTNPGNQSNAVGDPVGLAISATDPNSDALTYSATGLPAGLSIDRGSGIISSSINVGDDSASPYTVTVTASDGLSSASQTFTWTVSHIVVAGIADQNSDDGDTASLQVSARSNDHAALTYSAAGLPPGLGINGSSGLISGTTSSTADTGTPYAVTVTAADTTGHSSSQSFFWSVTKLSVTNPGNQQNADGDVVSLPIAAQGPEGATLSYSATGLPAGLSINSAGVIVGTISGTTDAGSPYTVTVTASDGHGISASQTFTWTVSHIYVAPCGEPSLRGTPDGEPADHRPRQPGGYAELQRDGTAGRADPPGCEHRGHGSGVRGVHQPLPHRGDGGKHPGANRDRGVCHQGGGLHGHLLPRPDHHGLCAEEQQAGVLAEPRNRDRQVERPRPDQGERSWFRPVPTWHRRGYGIQAGKTEDRPEGRHDHLPDRRKKAHSSGSAQRGLLHRGPGEQRHQGAGAGHRGHPGGDPKKQSP